MNAGMIVLDDGTPCFVHDDELPVILSLEYHVVDRMVTLVWNDAKKKQQKLKLEYPLDPRIGALLEKYQITAISRLKDDKVEYIRLVPVDLT